MLTFIKKINYNLIKNKKLFYSFLLSKYDANYQKLC